MTEIQQLAVNGDEPHAALEGWSQALTGHGRAAWRPEADTELVLLDVYSDREREEARFGFGGGTF